MSDPFECPGKGKCHGCLCWCDICGDVDVGVCDSPGCMVHHCGACKKMLDANEIDFACGMDWYRWCFACWVKGEMKLAIVQGKDEIVAAAKAEAEIAEYRRPA